MLHLKEIERKIAELAGPIAAAAGLEVLLVELVGSGHNSILRVYLDKSDGVTLDDCKLVSRELGPVLDVEDPIGHPYSLEVSSPGLDRPLVKAADYRRFQGQLARLRTRRPLDGARSFKGRISSFEGDDSSGEIVLNSEDGREHRIPYEAIERGRLIPEF
ncbi:MAG: ribosome maturation factor RimP [Myxococcales bacterium]|nr:ribosome maturation factor RimP [Myxococcales bacterium]